MHVYLAPKSSSKNSRKILQPRPPSIELYTRFQSKKGLHSLRSLRPVINLWVVFLVSLPETFKKCQKTCIVNAKNEKNCIPSAKNKKDLHSQC